MLAGVILDVSAFQVLTQLKGIGIWLLLGEVDLFGRGLVGIHVVGAHLIAGFGQLTA